VHRERGMEKSRRRREAAGKMPRRRRVEAVTSGNGMLGTDGHVEQNRSMWGTQGTQQSMLDASNGYGHRKSGRVLLLSLPDPFHQRYLPEFPCNHQYFKVLLHQQMGFHPYQQIYFRLYRHQGLLTPRSMARPSLLRPNQKLFTT
jgi:hypothetical protein